MSHSRYAIYFTTENADLATFGARWLGWDILRGQMRDHYDIAGLPEVTATPRRYGFHATLKPPFHLAVGQSVEDLRLSVRALAKDLCIARGATLELNALGRFLALTLQGDTTQIDEVAARCVAELDHFRAPPSDAELTKRRKPGLSPEREALLLRWGYPHVMEAFRFHMTLTQRVSRDQIDHWRTVASATLPTLEKPFEMTSICLVGERPDQHFELIERFALEQ